MLPEVMESFASRRILRCGTAVHSTHPTLELTA